MKHSAFSAQPVPPDASVKTGAIAPIKQAIQNILEQCFNRFVQPSQIRIRQRLDRSGKAYWQVYNPITGKSQYFNSEAEVRVWLEQQYHC